MRSRSVFIFFSSLVLPRYVGAQSNSSIIPASGSDIIINTNFTNAVDFAAMNVSIPWYSSGLGSSKNETNEEFIDDAYDLSYTWNVDLSVAPIDDSDEFQALSVASLSWPEGEGPIQDGSTTRACAFALSTIFTPLSPPLSNGSCTPVFGEICLSSLYAVASEALDAFGELPIGQRQGEIDGDPCSGSVADIPVPQNCSSIFGEGSIDFIYSNLTSGALGLNESFVMRVVNGTDANSLLTDEYDVIWPMGLMYMPTLLNDNGTADTDENGATLLELQCLQVSNSSSDATSWTASANAAPVNTSSNSDSVGAATHGGSVAVWHWVAPLLAVSMLVLDL